MDNRLQSSTVAVIVHVFYLHIWKEVAACIRNVIDLSSKADIFITISDSCDKQLELLIRKYFPFADIKRLPNRGFDVAPFFEVLNRINLDEYDYVVKLHTKRNCFGIVNFWPFFGGQWRRNLLGFCKTRKRLLRTLEILAHNQDVGMVGAGSLALKSENELVGKYSMRDCGYMATGFSESDNRCFIAGTMFIVRARLLQGLKQKYVFEDFSYIQPGCHDVSNAHGVEREFGHEIYNQGYKIGFHPKMPMLLASTMNIRRALYGFLCSILRFCSKL